MSRWGISFGLVLLAAGGVAIVGARSQVGGWNDGSRLATVESLVDYHTLAIDQSVFTRDTCDKLFIDGRYYSDKSPVPGFLIAGAYQAYQWLGGPMARDRKDAFVYAMTLVSSGLAYVLAVAGVFWVGRIAGLPLPGQWILTGSFGLATVAPVYAQTVNNHILLLAVSCWLTVGVLWLKDRAAISYLSVSVPACVLGALAGLAYSIDLGTGPMLFGATFLYVVYRSRHWRPVALFVLAALPWLALHHAVNYAIGGSWKPANALPEYFLWPGCPFARENMTGSWAHENIIHFLSYAGQLLLGKQGFLGHNLPLILGGLAGMVMVKRRLAESPELVWAFGCSLLTWLIYAWHSNNYSGQCCSIRWFVPVIAQGYLMLALALQRYPGLQSHLVFFSIWGAFQVGMMWTEGPWMTRMLPGYWVIQGLVLVSYMAFVIWGRHFELRRMRNSRVALRPGLRKLFGRFAGY